LQVAATVVTTVTREEEEEAAAVAHGAVGCEARSDDIIAMTTSSVQ